MLKKSLKGIATSKGIAIGKIVPFGHPTGVPKRESASPAAEEWGEFLRATALVDRKISEMQSFFLTTANSDEAIEILDSHRTFLTDPEITSAIQNLIFSSPVSSAWAVNEAFTQAKELLLKVDLPHVSEKTGDLTSVCDMLLEILLGTCSSTFEDLSAQIVAAPMFSPKDIFILARANVAGIVSETGSYTSHVGILTRNLNIPAVLGVTRFVSTLEPATLCILDGSRGVVELNPNEQRLRNYQARKTAWDTYTRELSEKSPSPCCSVDGTEFQASANLESSEEAKKVAELGASSIGLVRLEYFYLNRASIPSEENIYHEIISTIKDFSEKEITIRLLDMGGDKIVPSLALFVKRPTNHAARNPAMSERGIRALLKMPQILTAQCRAIVRANTHGNVRLMVPFVTNIEEIRSVISVVRQAWQEISASSPTALPFPKIGMMVELPAAVAVIGQFAREVDFFSIGTNDLVQHSLAVDRTDLSVAHLYEPLHPAIIKQVSSTLEEARNAQIPCSMCGEMASEPLFVELLAGMGLRDFSCSISSIPLIKEILRRIDVTESEALAREVFTMKSSKEIRRRIEERFLQKFGNLFPVINPDEPDNEPSSDFIPMEGV